MMIVEENEINQTYLAFAAVLYDQLAKRPAVSGTAASAEAIEGVQMQRKVLLIVAKDAVDIGKGLSR